MKKIALPIFIPEFAYRYFQTIFNKLKIQKNKNLLGDREIEWSWIAAHIPEGTGVALDVGSGGSPLGLMAAIKGYEAYCIDLREISLSYNHSRLRLIQGDLLTMHLPELYFDLIINCSTIEHIGLAGRYGIIQENIDGDIEMMERLNKLMKPEATMLLTCPIGIDAIFPPFHRVYGQKRLPRLLKGFLTQDECYWIKNDDNRWISADKESALNTQPIKNTLETDSFYYALGCFILKKNSNKE